MDLIDVKELRIFVTSGSDLQLINDVVLHDIDHTISRTTNSGADLGYWQLSVR